jgi:hypothetical protein
MLSRFSIVHTDVTAAGCVVPWGTTFASRAWEGHDQDWQCLAWPALFQSLSTRTRKNCALCVALSEICFGESSQSFGLQLAGAVHRVGPLSWGHAQCGPRLDPASPPGGGGRTREVLAMPWRSPRPEVLFLFFSFSSFPRRRALIDADDISFWRWWGGYRGGAVAYPRHILRGWAPLLRSVPIGDAFAT